MVTADASIQQNLKTNFQSLFLKWLYLWILPNKLDDAYHNSSFIKFDYQVHVVQSVKSDITSNQCQHSVTSLLY